MDTETPRWRIDLNTIISEIEKVFRTVVEDQILLRTRLDPALGLGCVDPRKIEAVLVNLFMRSRDAMAPGSELTVTTSNLALDQTAAREISLDPGLYALIELRFTRGANGGFHRALNVPVDVRDTILQAQGTIWIENGQDRETILRIALPAVPRPGLLTF